MKHDHKCRTEQLKHLRAMLAIHEVDAITEVDPDRRAAALAMARRYNDMIRRAMAGER